MYFLVRIVHARGNSVNCVTKPEDFPVFIKSSRQPVQEYGADILCQDHEQAKISVNYTPLAIKNA
jgi:hypothetical protein